MIKLENFTAEIDVQQVIVTGVNDSIVDKTCSVSILINEMYGYTLTGFDYSDTWEDSEVQEWAVNELKKFEI